VASFDALQVYKGQIWQVIEPKIHFCIHFIFILYTFLQYGMSCNSHWSSLHFYFNVWQKLTQRFHYIQT